jgi:hypothetical protein
MAQAAKASVPTTTQPGPMRMELTPLLIQNETEQDVLVDSPQEEHSPDLLPSPLSLSDVPMLEPSEPNSALSPTSTESVVSLPQLPPLSPLGINLLMNKDQDRMIMLDQEMAPL